MTVRYNSAWSKWHSLVGGSPQGSWMGQMAYIAASDDAARGLEDQDKFKFCDDLTILELVMMGGLLTEYDFKSHVASDIAVDQKFLDPTLYNTQSNLDELQSWTSHNKMRLNEKKTNYVLFTRTRESFSTRLTVNKVMMERQNSIKGRKEGIMSSGSGRLCLPISQPRLCPGGKQNLSPRLCVFDFHSYEL